MLFVPGVPSFDMSAGVMLGVLSGKEVLANVTANAFVFVTTTSEAAVSTPLEASGRCAASDCRALAPLGCRRVLHARMPACHVCSAFPALPQFPNQEPLRAQQLRFPDFPMVPHLRQRGLMVVTVVTAGITATYKR